MAVYFIQAADGSGPVKIGYAKNPFRRLMEIQRMSPTELKLLKAIEGDRTKEARLHTRFGKYRLHGEWFRPVPAVMNFIRSRTELKAEQAPRCAGYTIAGNSLSRCKSRPKKDHAFCKRHLPQAETGPPELPQQCKGFITGGRRCDHKSLKGTDFCKQHQDQKGIWDKVPVVLTPQHVADFFNCSRETLRRKVRKGEIPAVRITSRSIRFNKIDLMKMLGYY